MKGLFFILGVTLLQAAGLHACSEPLDYRRLSTIDVYGSPEVKLVLLATFKRQVNSTMDYPGGSPRIYARIETEVKCVLKNLDNVTVPQLVNITEVRYGSYDEIGLCIDRLYDIRFDQEVVTMATPHTAEDLEGELEFGTFNLQGPYFYTADTSVSSILNACGFQAPEKPQGVATETCPSVTTNADECYTAGGRRSQTEYVLLGVCMIAVILGLW